MPKISYFSSIHIANMATATFDDVYNVTSVIRIDIMVSMEKILTDQDPRT